MLQKPAKLDGSIIENPDYKLSDEVSVTKQIKLRKGHGFQKPNETFNQTGLSRTADQGAGNFEGHIQGVIEASYAQPSKNMIIQAGVSVIERDKVLGGLPLDIQSRISLKDYKKMIDPVAQQAAMQAERLAKKNKTSYSSTINEDPYRSFRKFALAEADSSTLQTANNEDYADRSGGHK